MVIGYDSIPNMSKRILSTFPLVMLSVAAILSVRNLPIAAVYGYTDEGTLELVREGTNDLVCMADHPERPGFEASCYHKALHPYVARGLELRAEGVDGMATVAQRGKESEAGSLEWPDHDATMYIRFGEDAVYNPETMTVENSRIRYVIYSPYATTATTGLPEQAMAPGAPWLMSAGTFRSHIMIVPPPPTENEPTENEPTENE